MLVSELIKRLKTLQNRFGDVTVGLEAQDSGGSYFEIVNVHSVDVYDSRNRKLRLDSSFDFDDEQDETVIYIG